MNNDNVAYVPSQGEEANRICEEIAIFHHKNPNFLNEIPAEFIKRIAEILGKMKI